MPFKVAWWTRNINLRLGADFQGSRGCPAAKVGIGLHSELIGSAGQQRLNIDLLIVMRLGDHFLLPEIVVIKLVIKNWFLFKKINLSP